MEDPVSFRVQQYADQSEGLPASNGRLPQRGEIDAAGVKIGQWVQNQRDKHNAGQLITERVAALEGVPGWTWRFFVMTEVDVWLNALRAYKEANGHLPKHRDSWGDLNIGFWINNQRNAYRKGLLPAELVASLEAVPGWVWKLRNVRKVVPFEAGLACLNRFVQAHGRLPNTRETGDNPNVLHLGGWLSSCRSRKKQGKLTADQITALEQVPGWGWRSKTPFRL